MIISCERKLENNSVDFKDFKTWWAYYNENIKFHKDYESLNVNDKYIRKKHFLIH